MSFREVRIASQFSRERKKKERKRKRKREKKREGDTTKENK